MHGRSRRGSFPIPLCRPSAPHRLMTLYPAPTLPHCPTYAPTSPHNGDPTPPRRAAPLNLTSPNSPLITSIHQTPPASARLASPTSPRLNPPPPAPTRSTSPKLRPTLPISPCPTHLPYRPTLHFPVPTPLYTSFITPHNPPNLASPRLTPSPTSIHLASPSPRLNSTHLNSTGGP